MNKCGTCTLCCYLFEIPELNKKRCSECIYCNENTGCSIYNDRPTCCLGFNCSYLQAGLHPALRPDNCGIIFEKINDWLFYGTRDTRKDLSDIAKGQIQSFNKQGFSVVIREDKNKVFLTGDHTMKQVTDAIKEYSRNHGST